MTVYVALLRGINAGVTVKMQVLKQIFEDLGLQDVQTVLATGNVLFNSRGQDPAKLELKLEKAIHEALGYRTTAVVRTLDDIRRLADTRPFKSVPATPQMVPQASFLKISAPIKPATYPIVGIGYTILGVYDRVACSVVDLSGGATPDLMAVLDRQYNKAVTTRNWKTVEKIIAKGATYAK